MHLELAHNLLSLHYFTPETVLVLSLLLVIIAEAHVNPRKPEVRRNLDRVYDHIQHPRITNCTA